MKKAVHSLAIGLTLFGGAQTALATGAEDVQIVEPYVRAVPPGQPNSAAFMTLVNGGDSDHALVAGSSPASKVVELHTHEHADGMMKMRQVERIDVAAGGETPLQPGGYHVMMIGLHDQLKPGQEVSLTLEYEDGSSVEVTAPVRKVTMDGMNMKGMDGKDGMKGMDGMKDGM